QFLHEAGRHRRQRHGAVGRAQARQLRQRQHLRLHKPSPGFGVYSAANMGMISMTRTLAVELAPRGITVNCLAPGIIVTDMLVDTMKISREEAHATFSELIPLGRTGTPEDCAAAAVFFASPAARWITGQFIDVAGGQPN
ncbi:MAG: SDR family oxidoreductase, partial [Pseudomonadota bacterium]